MELAQHSVTQWFQEPTGPTLDIHIAVPRRVERELIEAGLPVPDPVPAHALIDTGATGTLVRPAVVHSLNLNPVGTTTAKTPRAAAQPTVRYHVKLLLPGLLGFKELDVDTLDLPGQDGLDCLIGRNLLNMGVLVYIGQTKQFTLAF